MRLRTWLSGSTSPAGRKLVSRSARSRCPTRGAAAHRDSTPARGATPCWSLPVRRSDPRRGGERLAYNLANSLRQLVLPKPIQGWTLTTLREKLVKIGAKVVYHAKYIVFQLAEVAVPRLLFAAILERIGRLRLAEASG
jgi:Transposase DDE domain group 1